MNVSASLDVKMGSGSSLKYCFNMSAMSYGDNPSKSVLSVSEQQQMITLLFIEPCAWERNVSLPDQRFKLSVPMLSESGLAHF